MNLKRDTAKTEIVPQMRKKIAAGGRDEFFAWQKGSIVKIFVA